MGRRIGEPKSFLLQAPSWLNVDLDSTQTMERQEIVRA
jgi:hypothetical protein